MNGQSTDQIEKKRARKINHEKVFRDWALGDNTFHVYFVCLKEYGK